MTLNGYLVRVGRDHRAVEHALSMPPSLFHGDLDLDGAVVDATLAIQSPALLEKLRARHVEYIIDPETLRFGTPAYKDVEQLAKLVYAPEEPITSDTSADVLRQVTLGSLEVQAAAGASAYVAPHLPLTEDDGTLRLNRRLLSAAADLVGTEVERLPLIAALAPSLDAMRDSRRVKSMLSDSPVEQVHVQPTRLRATDLSVGSLERYAGFLADLQTVGIPAIAGRAGPFGLALIALGVGGFDAGLTTAEGFDLNSLISNARRRRERRESGDAGEERRTRGRFYFDQLKTTVPAEVTEAITAAQGLRHRFVSDLPCCGGGFAELLNHRREHCLFARAQETRKLSELPPSMRGPDLAGQLAAARDTAKVVTRVLSEHGIRPPKFDHLERWRLVLLENQQKTEAA